MIDARRMTARLDGEFVVFLLGMRLNRPLQVHRWLPVAAAMPRMLRELAQRPELGLLACETWFSRTLVLVQYWRSIEQLLAYATARDAEHLPAWRAFNRAIGTDGAVGLWHETYVVRPGQYESVYVDMPAFGLGRAGTLVPANGSYASAAGRLGTRDAQ